MKYSAGQKIQITLLSDDCKYIFEQRTTRDKSFVIPTLNPQKSYNHEEKFIIRTNTLIILWFIPCSLSIICYIVSLRYKVFLDQS